MIGIRSWTIGRSDSDLVANVLHEAVLVTCFGLRAALKNSQLVRCCGYHGLMSYIRAAG